MDTSEKVAGVDKIERYGWKSTGLPGRLQYVHKRLIKTDYDGYQREVTEKAEAICRDFSWMAMGCLILARRPDGTLWVVDGNNRLTACLRRSDIETVPCIIFDVVDVKQEASGFIGANKNRKPVSSLDTFRAMKTAGSPEHGVVVRMLDELGLHVSGDSDNPKGVKCVSQLLEVVRKCGETEARTIFAAVHALVHGKSRWMKAHVQGMAWLHTKLDCERGVGNEVFLTHCRECDIERFNKSFSMNTVDHTSVHAGKSILYAVNYGRRKVLFGKEILGG
jgi:hypothetical protein